MGSSRLLAALAALDSGGSGTDTSSGGGDFSAVDALLAPKPQPKKSGGFDWHNALGTILNDVTIPLHAVTAAAVEGGREVGHDLLGKDYGENNPSLQNYIDMMIKPSKEINVGDVVSGKPEKGLTEGIFANGDRTPAGSLFDVTPPKLVQSAVGLGGDMLLDPLSYLDGGGIAKEALGREAAQSTARQALAKAAELEQGVAPSAASFAVGAGGDAAKVTSLADIEHAINDGGDVAEALGKVREAGNAHPEVQDILNRGMDVSARARRFGISHLNPDEITSFLTREGTLDEPLARRGLTLGEGGHVIPGTDRGVLAKLGELKSAGVAKLGDHFGGSTVDKLFTEQTTRELKAAAKSGSPKAAYEAILTQAARDTAKAGTRHLIATWSGRLATLTKDFSDEDWKNLTPALEGDEAAKEALGHAHEGVRQLLDDIHSRATEAGLNINKLADYAPRELSPEGRQLLHSLGLGSERGTLSPLSSFEVGRKLVPDEDGLYHFAGETFEAKTNAEVTAKVNEIAQRELAKVDPEAAAKMEGFFNKDADAALNHYFNRAAKRVTQSDAASRLYAMGLGNAKYTTVPDAEALAEAGSNRAAADAADQKSLQMLERATMHEGAQDELGRHLLGQRLGQLDNSLAGNPVTSPLSDAQTTSIAAAAQRDAADNLVSAHNELSALEARDAARATARTASEQTLTSDIAELRDGLTKLQEIAAKSDSGIPAGLRREIAGYRQRILALENEAGTWATRRDAVLSDALAGNRPDVVMPEGGWRGVVAGDATPAGAFKEVRPEVAWRNAGHLSVAADQIVQDGETFDTIRRAIASADSQAEKTNLFGRLMSELHIAPPGFSGELTSENANEVQSAMDRYLGTVIHDDPIEMKRALGRIEKGLKGEAKRIGQEREAAANLAEKATVRGDNGIVTAPFYHSSSTPIADFKNATDLPAEQVLDNLDLGALYTSTDQSGQIALGQDGRILSDEEHVSGYVRKGSGDQPHVYGFQAKDPSVPLLPTARAIMPEDITPQLEGAVHEFYGGDHWQWGEPLDTGDEHLNEIANGHSNGPFKGDPIAAFLAHDLQQTAAEHGVNVSTSDIADAFFGAEDNKMKFIAGVRQLIADRATAAAPELESQTSTVGGLASTAVTTDDEWAANVIRNHIDHWYDDFGIKGVTRKGNVSWGSGDITHDHMIWWRPNDDLEMVGKSDFTAAYADKRVADIMAHHQYVTDIIKENESKLNVAVREQQKTVGVSIKNVEEKLAEKEQELAKLPKSSKESIKTVRARAAVQAAQEQNTTAEQYLKDTVDEIRARRAAHLEETRRITAFLQSGAPLPDSARESMQSYIDDLHQSVLFGHYHERALELGDTQMQRISSLEQAAAEASAQAHNLHQTALDLRASADVLSERTVEQFSHAFNAGIKAEVRPGIGTPQQIADWLYGAHPLSTSDGARAFFKKWDKVVGWIKDWQIATPGFHVRNLLGGEFLNEQAGVSLESRLQFIRTWSRMLRGRDDLISQADRDLFNKVRQAIGKGQVEAESGMGLEGGLLKGEGTLNPLSRSNYWIRGSQKAGMNVDFYNRGVLAWHTLSNGGTLDDAVNAVNHFHFDYSDLSSFEQKMRHFVPFYTWTRKNLPLQVEQLLTNPRIYARLGEAKYEIENQSMGDKTVPSYYQDLLGIRLPWEHGGGHMYADPNLPASSIAEFGDPSSALRNVEGMVTPIIKTPIEYQLHKQFFENIPLSDSKAVPVPLPGLVLKGLAPALQSLGLAKDVDGNLVMTQRNAYVLQQFIPVLARYSRLMPGDAKGRSRQMAQLLTWAGFRVEDNTKEVQDSFARGEKFAAQDAKRTKKAFDKSARKLGQG